MQGMDGFELSRRIREMGFVATFIVLIASFEHTTAEVIAKNAGVNKIISKPVFPSVLVDIINEYAGIDMFDNVKISAADEEDHCFKGYHILLADDVDINREIALALFEPTMLTADCAVNGADAVRMFSEAPDKYDLIFMDIQMPEMDGYEATRCIRAMDIQKAKNIPIIAMTANVFKEDIEKCIKAGMNNHVGKPFDIEVILEVLKYYLKKT